MAKKTRYSAEERRLFKRAAEGDKEARNQIFEKNQNLIWFAYHKWFRNQQRVPQEDLLQEGALGLLKGIERFDINKGNTFATYVVFWIRQAMQRYICKQGDIIRKPVHRYAEFAKIRKTATELTQKLGKTPTPSEIADELQWPVDQVEDDIEFFSSVASLNTPVAANDPESMSLINFVADESAESPSHAAETTLLRERLEKVIDAFPQRTRTIFLMRFGLEPYPREYTLEEIGQKVGLTRERVRQILNKGFQSMALHNRSLKRWLEEEQNP